MGDQLVRRRQSPVMQGSGWQREGFRPSEHLRHHSNVASTTKPTGQNLILMLPGVIAKMPINFKNCASNRSWYLRSKSSCHWPIASPRRVQAVQQLEIFRPEAHRLCKSTRSSLEEI